MALIGISCGDTFEYVSEGDPSKRRVDEPIDPKHPDKGSRTKVVIDDDATVFELGVLDVFLMGMIYDRASAIAPRESDGELAFSTRVNQTNIEAVRYGLRGWRNFLDRDGKEIPFETKLQHAANRKYQVVTDECLNRLGIRRIRELGQQIKDRSEVQAAEEKNSATA
jgi:hypothetical protein